MGSIPIFNLYSFYRSGRRNTAFIRQNAMLISTTQHILFRLISEERNVSIVCSLWLASHPRENVKLFYLQYSLVMNTMCVSYYWLFYDILTTSEAAASPVARGRTGTSRIELSISYYNHKSYYTLCNILLHKLSFNDYSIMLFNLE